MRLLASHFSRCPLMLTEIQEATAYGTALLVKAALENKHPTELASFVNLQSETVRSPGLADMQEYTETYLRWVEMSTQNEEMRQSCS
jgi:sugar (pentulose or hexulose) kinase